MDELVIGSEDPRSPDVQALLEAHRAYAMAHSPLDEVHVLDVDALQATSVSFFSIRAGGALLGVAALKELDEVHAEIKSMHIAEVARQRGIGRTMLDHLVSTARIRGYRRVSLETGTGPPFAPAHALYESAGFERCEPFGEYWSSPNSICMTLGLQPAD